MRMIMPISSSFPGIYILDCLTSGSLAYLSGSTHGPLPHVSEPKTNPGLVQYDLRSGDITIQDAAARATMHPLGKLLFLDGAAVRTCLRSVSGVDLDQLATG